MYLYKCTYIYIFQLGSEEPAFFIAVNKEVCDDIHINKETQP